MSQFADMKIAGLKQELRKHHLQVSGNKATLLKRLTDFLRPVEQEEKKQEEEKRPERLKQSQRQTINIYTDGKVDKTHSNAKNIYIEPRSYEFPPKPILPSGYNPFMSTSTSSSSGLKPTDKLYPMPQRPTAAILQESIPLPPDVKLPNPSYNEDEDLQKTIASFEKMLGEKDEDEKEQEEEEQEEESNEQESEDMKELIESRQKFEEELAKRNEEKKNEDEGEEMVPYRQKVPTDPEYPFGVVKKKNIKKK
jgi:hypothetical protein